MACADLSRSRFHQRSDFQQAIVSACKAPGILARVGGSDGGPGGAAPGLGVGDDSVLGAQAPPVLDGRVDLFHPRLRFEGALASAGTPESKIPGSWDVQNRGAKTMGSKLSSCMSTQMWPDGSTHFFVLRITG